jgi:hypothetical protein
MLIGMIFLCALLALISALIRIGLSIALLLACLAYVWLAGAAVTLWLARKAHYR